MCTQAHDMTLAFVVAWSQNLWTSSSRCRADEIRANLDRMGIEHSAAKIDQLVRAAQKKRRIEGVPDGPAEFYNDKVRRPLAVRTFRR